MYQKILHKIEKNRIPLNGTFYDFSVAHRSIGKEEIFNIHEYLKADSRVR